MNALMIMFLFVTSQPDLACGQVSVSSGLSRQMATAPVDRKDSFVLVANRSIFASPVAYGSASETATVDADLGYYVGLHAQALSESDGPSMNPWIELHPVGANGGVAPTASEVSQSAEPPAAGADRFGKLLRSRSRHACS